MGQYSIGYHAAGLNARGQWIDAEGRVLMRPTKIRVPQLFSTDGTHIGATIRSVDGSGGGTVWLPKANCAEVPVPAPLLLGRPVRSAIVVVVADAGAVPPTVVGVEDSAGTAGDVLLDEVGHEQGVVSWSTVEVA